jgi:predicted HicB family RNase H-like nuclease
MAGSKWNKTMNNILDIEGFKASISYDPDIEMLRGEFIGLNGGADFYASSIDALREEGQQSLKVFLEMCREKGIEPKRPYSGKFNLRLDPAIHEAAVLAATSENKSLNEWVVDTISHAVAR